MTIQPASLFTGGLVGLGLDLSRARTGGATAAVSGCATGSGCRRKSNAKHRISRTFKAQHLSPYWLGLKSVALLEKRRAFTLAPGEGPAFNQRYALRLPRETLRIRTCGAAHFQNLEFELRSSSLVHTP